MGFLSGVMWRTPCRYAKPATRSIYATKTRLSQTTARFCVALWNFWRENLTPH